MECEKNCYRSRWGQLCGGTRNAVPPLNRDDLPTMRGDIRPGDKRAETRKLMPNSRI